MLLLILNEEEVGVRVDGVAVYAWVSIDVDCQVRCEQNQQKTVFIPLGKLACHHATQKKVRELPDE